MARRWGVALAAGVSILFIPCLAVAQLGNVPELSLPSKPAKPDLRDVKLIDDALDLGPAWTYEPDVPEAEVEPLVRPMSIGLPYNTRAIAFSADSAAIAGVLQDNRESDGTGKSIQRWLVHRYKLTTGQAGSPVKLYSQTTESRTPSAVRPDRGLIVDDEQELIDIQWQRMATSARGLLEKIPGYVMDPAAQAAFPAGPYPDASATAEARAGAAPAASR